MSSTCSQWWERLKEGVMFDISFGIKVRTPEPPPVVATNIVFMPAADSFDAPVPPGTTMGTYMVEPEGWVGTVTTTGDNAAFFAAMSDGRIINVVELQDIAPGDDPDYTVGLHAEP